MKLPGSGSWMATVLSSLDPTAYSGAEQAEVTEVTEAQLDEALAALARGDIEFVILEDGQAFLQVGGSGRGPYEIEYVADAATPGVEIPGGVDDETVRHVMQAYRRRDTAWNAPYQWHTRY